MLQSTPVLHHTLLKHILCLCLLGLVTVVQGYVIIDDRRTLHGNDTAVSFSGRAARAVVYKKCTVPKTAAITFDDGPYDYMYTIGATLKKAGAKGTFFFNGNNFGCIYAPDNVERVKYAYSQGHQVASHGWSHQYLTNLSASQIRTEMALVDQALRKIIGVTPAFMRPAYGEYNSLVEQVATERGQSLVIWDFDSGDATGASVSQQKTAFANLVKKHPSNVLTVNHETHW
ncbi:hypothetical protein D9619_009114 [Psilocybe cf. subviscida]|uniref:NodB homology domain-containing protein n=1 Tax=Psilocybe cf. subviscida TaxID=2480587 RepID=A0A8H5FAZ9_9AGAR|nr:hypothetical protein D9619_009114 [Psilocybe cf. subviscida]